MSTGSARTVAPTLAALVTAFAGLLSACSGVYPPPRDGSTTDARRADARTPADVAAPEDAVEDGLEPDSRVDDAAPDEAELDASEADAGLDAPAPIDARADAPVPIDAQTDALADAPRDASSPVDARADATTDAASDAVTDAVTATGCPADMVAQDAFCIDRYEAPNERGASPLAMQTATDGERWCAARGRRLCSEAEWVSACQGASMRRFPYGTTYVRGRCVDDKTWRSPNWTLLGTWPSGAAMNEARRLYQAEPSGAREGCASEDGVMDLAGNVAEWVTRSFPNANNYAHVMRGCYWAGCYGGAPPSCTFVNPAHPGTFRTYEAGFRCCTERAP